MHEEITLTREVEAIQIPSGDLISLPAGTLVMITQALGEFVHHLRQVVGVVIDAEAVQALAAFAAAMTREV